MKKNFLFRFFFIAGFVLFFSGGCAGAPDKKTGPVTEEDSPESRERPWIITDYQGRGNAQSDETAPLLPSWLSAFLNGGNRGTETLEEFVDHFVFVAVNSGTNIHALRQWQEGFSPELDFPRLAAVRIENRFLFSLTAYPDDEYGSYFETAVRAASDSAWEGAVRREDFWIKRQFTDVEEEAFSPETGLFPREIYDFFILLTVEKTALVPQIDALLLGVKPVPPLTNDQNAAVNRVREHFYENF